MADSISVCADSCIWMDMDHIPKDKKSLVAAGRNDRWFRDFSLHPLGGGKILSYAPAKPLEDIITCCGFYGDLYWRSPSKRLEEEKVETS